MWAGGPRYRPPAHARSHVEVHDVLDLTVTFDHNVIDGAPGARFFAQRCGLVHPMRTMIVVVGPELAQCVQQLGVVPDNGPVQQFAATLGFLQSGGGTAQEGFAPSLTAAQTRRAVLPARPRAGRWWRLPVTG